MRLFVASARPCKCTNLELDMVFSGNHKKAPQSSWLIYSFPWDRRWLFQVLSYGNTLYYVVLMEWYAVVGRNSVDLHIQPT